MGSKDKPDNYRGITLLSCLGKLLTAVINHRLEKFIHEKSYIGNEQAGFRKGHSTADHIFVLHTLLEMYVKNNKRLYTCFVDYKKAFDNVNRLELWRKILKAGINGPIFNIILNLYQNAKSCIKNNNNTLSQFFPCNIGVRQGENLSPLLFAIFLSDLEEHMSKSYDGVLNVKNLFTDESELSVYIKLYIMWHADDTVILAENATELQKALNAMHSYCILNKLEINVSKTKVLIFSKGKLRKVPTFYFNNQEIEMSTQYSYLGIMFNFNGSFKNATSILVEQATRAMYSLLDKVKKMLLPLDIQLQLFDALVKPILLYGSEIWGFQNTESIEKVHLKFMKRILSVNRSTTSSMVYGEMGRFPLSIYIKKRIIGFWGRLIDCNQNKLSSLMYKVIYNLHVKGSAKCAWIENVKSILNNCGLSSVWKEQNFSSLDWLKETVFQRCKDQYLQSWYSSIEQGNKCINYRIFKLNHELEDYLIHLPQKYRIPLTRFRCRNSNLPIEVGAHHNIERSKRVCPLCKKGIGDEYHYLLDCTFFDKERKLFIDKYFWSKPSTIKMSQLLNSKGKQLIQLIKFVKIIMNKLKK